MAIEAIAVEVGLQILKKVVAAWSSASEGGGDLIKFTAPSRVEPICLIDSDVVHHEALPDVMQSLQSIFSGYYLQAMAISTTIGKIDVVKQLDKLNPNRNLNGHMKDAIGASANWVMSAESYKHSLPKPGKMRLSTEAYGANGKDDIIVTLGEEKDDKSNTNPLGKDGKDTLVTVKELTNLSVGKLLNVEITDGSHKATIPIAIRLMATSIPTSSVVHILSLGNKDVTAKERYHGWRSGRLEFWRDIVMCQDLIDAHKKNLLADKTGVYNEILKRRSNNNLSTLVSGNPSIATASNLLVCSKETIRTLEGEIGRELKDFKTREKIFAESYLMIIAVIDKDWDRVTFYHRGINLPTEVSLRDLRVSNKSTGPDVGEILKAYQLGSSPSL